LFEWLEKMIGSFWASERDLHHRPANLEEDFVKTLYQHEIDKDNLDDLMSSEISWEPLPAINFDEGFIDEIFFWDDDYDSINWKEEGF